MERHELVEGTSAKFWQWEVRGSDLVVEYGRLGTKGQASVKSFDSPAAAQAAAAKLVKEKTGKGYALAAGGSAVAVAAPAVAPAASDHPPTPWITEEALAELAGKLAKKSKRSPVDIVETVVGSDSGHTNATLAALHDRGMLPARLLGDLAGELTRGSAWLSLATLAAMPHADWVPARLLPLLLLRLGARAPERVAPATDASYPPAAARLLPLTRRRLGMSTEPLPDDVARELARGFVAGHGTHSEWELEAPGVLGIRQMNTYAESQAWAVSLGIAADRWDALVDAAADVVGFGSWWRIEPIIRKATLADLRTIIPGLHDADGAFLFDLFTTRTDDPDDLVALALGMSPGKPTWDHRGAYRVREAIALCAAARFATAGRAVPTSLDDCIWFLDTAEPTHSNPAYAVALAAFPPDRILARVRAHIKPATNKSTQRVAEVVQVAVGLGVAFDEALFERLLAEACWAIGEGPVYCGRLPIAVLPRFIARLAATPEGELGERVGLTTAIQAILVTHAQRTSVPFAAEHDHWFAPEQVHVNALWEAAVALLPQPRKDAYMLAWARLDPYEWQRQLPACSDAAIDEVIGLMFEMRHARGVHVTYPKGISFGWLGEMTSRVGPRALPMIARHHARFADARAREVLEAMPIAHHLLAGARVARPAAPPPVDPAAVAALDRLIDEMAAASEPSERSLKLASGSIFIATSGTANPKALGRNVPKGSYDVHTHYSELEPEGATAGLDAVCLRIGKAAVARWEEVLVGGEPILDGDVVSLVLGDEVAFASMNAGDREAVDGIIKSMTAYGEAVDVHKKKLLAAYIGEEAASHHVYWGLDDAGAPACLLARFVYRA